MSAATGSGQLPLVLRYPPDQRFDMYVEREHGAAHQLRGLLSAADTRGVFIGGAASTGKTHLAIAACAEAEAQGMHAGYLALASATGRLRDALDALHGFDLIAIDGIEAIAGERADETALFDFHNRVHDAGGRLLYTARAWPQDLSLVLPDLRSRLTQCARIALVALDDAGRGEVLRLRASRRGLQLEPPAIDWLLSHVNRDLSSLTALLDHLDRASLAAQRKPTVPFLRQLFGSTSQG